MRGALLVAGLVLVTGCSTGSPPSAGERSTSASPGPVDRPPPTPGAGEPAPSSSAAPVDPPPPPRVDPDDVRVRTATSTVEQLAGRIGPRPGTSPAYHRAARWVERRFGELGWAVERQRFPTPAGVSWGVPVPAGPSVNLVATRGDVVPGEPWLLVGAHLDTVPQAPGAEDNASGIGVLLAVAEATAARRTRLPVVLVAFGSEEPRGPTDDDHHYGSTAYVAALDAAARRSLRGMIALDRVGVGDLVPIGSPGQQDQHSRLVRAAADRAGVQTSVDTFQRSSDHWSFARQGLPGTRLGSTPYAGYHSPGDTVDVVDPAQLERTARVVLAWLA